MKTAFRSPRPASSRRGVTLIEMLVAVALLVLMMTVIVQVFSAATGAVSTQRVYQELDTSLRQVDTMIRQDLANVTARFTPPLDPSKNLGYFEYIENQFADNQGEDADDSISFTAKAPEGQVFTGRMYVQSALNASFATLTSAQTSIYFANQPITITSQYAEIIYFLRNGNLYRRVLLIAPELQSSVSQWTPGFIPGGPSPFGNTSAYNPTSWLGLNDLSARPNTVNAPTVAGSSEVIVLNTLGDLTNRENRAFRPRFVNDFTAVGDTSNSLQPDGEPDDQNGDTVPDFWPSLYYNAAANISVTSTGNSLLNEIVPSTVTMRPYAKYQTMAFPYIYPYSYSHPDENTLNLGWIHTPNASLTVSAAGGWLNWLNALNHNPLLSGDSLPLPHTNETYWGFPTWKETMGWHWTDPTVVLATNGQPAGLVPLAPNVLPVSTNTNFLPPMTTLDIPGTTTPFRLIPQPFNDGAGSDQFTRSNATTTADANWRQLWEDDLIMTGVRSFDVKALDNAYGNYVDLGWGDDLRLYAPYVAAATLSSATPPYLGHLSPTSPTDRVNQILNWPPSSSQNFSLYTQSVAHEGRIPPLIWDNKFDYQTGGINVGDDAVTTIRLRRTWDSWSTDYSYAPASGVNPNTGQPLGPPFSQAIFPSYPPPYPMPLRGIQIQIRVSDPRSERLKVLTIRQDFSDKL